MSVRSTLVQPDTGDGDYSHPDIPVLSSRIDGKNYDSMQLLADGRILTGAGDAPPSVGGSGDSLAVHALNAHGHSWIANPAWNSNFMPSFNQQSVLSRVCALLGIDSDDVNNMAVSASHAGAPTLPLFGTTMSGWAAICQLLVPPNSSIVGGPAYAVAGGGITSEALALPTGGHLWVHGVNDVGSLGYGFLGLLLDATNWGHAVRHYLARSRAGVLWGSTAVGSATTPAITWDSVISFTGAGWTDTPTPAKALGTGAATKANANNARAVNVTLPLAVPNDFMVTAEFISTPGFFTTLGTTLTNVAVSVVATDPGSAIFGYQFPQAGGFSVIIDNEVVLVTATTGGQNPTWTITRNQPGSVGGAVAHTAQSVVRRGIGDGLTDIAVSCSGDGLLNGVPVATSFSTQGIGQLGNAAAIVKRFRCQASDAGKILTFTTQNLNGTLDKVTFSCAFLETTDAPPPVAFANIPKCLAYNPELYGAADLYNQVSYSVISEFTEPQSIQIVDLDAFLLPRSALLTTALTNVATVVKCTALGTDFSPRIGLDLQIENEHMVVTGVAGTYPNYSLTVGRGARGSTAVTHAITTTTGGYPMTITRSEIWAQDGLHPSNAGAGAFAKLIVDAFGKCRLRNIQAHPAAAMASGNWIQGKRRRVTPGVGHGYVIKQPLTNTLVSGTPALSQLMLSMIEIPQAGYITAMQVFSAGGAGTALLRLGLYDVDATGARAGTLIREFGSMTMAAAAGVNKINGHLFVPMAGIYWVAAVQQGGTAQPVAALGLHGTRLMVPSTDDFASVTDEPWVGCTVAATAGALPVTPSAGGTPVIGGAAAAGNVIAAVGLTFSTKNWI